MKAKFRVWNGSKFLPSYSNNGEIFLHPCQPEDSFAEGSFVDVGWFLQCQRVENPQRFWVQQFIGLHDKNGAEIYEGDILKFSTNNTAPLGDKDIIDWTEQEVFFAEDTASFVFGRQYQFTMLDRIMPETVEVTGHILQTKQKQKKTQSPRVNHPLDCADQWKHLFYLQQKIVTGLELENMKLSEIIKQLQNPKANTQKKRKKP